MAEPNWYTLEVDGTPYQIDASSEEEAVAQLKVYLEQQGIAAPSAPAVPPMGYQPQTAGMATAEPYAPEPEVEQAIMPSMAGPFGPSADLLRGAATGAISRTVVGPGSMMTYAYANIGGRLLNELGITDATPEEIMDRYDNAGRDFLEMVRGTEAQNASRESKWGETVFDLGTAIALSPKNAATSFPKAIGLAAGEGALGAATTFDSLSDMGEKTNSIAAGTLFAAGATTGLKGLGWALGKTGKWILSKINSGGPEDQAAIIAELEQQFPGIAGLLTKGQQSGSPGMLKFEGTAAGRRALEAYQAQAAILEEGLKDFGRRWGGNWNAGELGVIAALRGQPAMRQLISDLANVRRTEWQAMIGSAEAAVTQAKTVAGDLASTEEVMFRVPNLQAKMTELLDEYDISKEGLDGIFRQFANEVTTFQDGVSMDTFLKMLKKTNGNNWNVTSQLKEEAAIRFGDDFRKMMFNVIDEADAAQNTATSFIKAARASYTQRSFDMDVARNSAISKYLGLDTPVASPTDALRQIARQSPEEAARTATWLSKTDPDLLGEIRKIAWDDVMKEATASVPASQSAHPFDPFRFAAKMLDRLGDAEAELGPAALQFRSLFSEADRMNMRNLLPKINRIMQNPPKGARSFDPESAVMTGGGALLNAPSKGVAQYLPFGIRQLYRLTMEDWLDARLFTAAGRRLIDDADKAVGTAKYNTALGALATYMMGTEPSMRLK